MFNEFIRAFGNELESISLSASINNCMFDAFILTVELTVLTTMATHLRFVQFVFHSGDYANEKPMDHAGPFADAIMYIWKMWCSNRNHLMGKPTLTSSVLWNGMKWMRFCQRSTLLPGSGMWSSGMACSRGTLARHQGRDRSQHRS
jgi:hypothetical protein